MKKNIFSIGSFLALILLISLGLNVASASGDRSGRRGGDEDRFRDFRELRDLRDLRDFRDLRDLDEIRFRDLRDIRDLDLRDFRDLDEIRFRDLFGVRGIRDVRDLDEIRFRDFNDLRLFDDRVRIDGNEIRIKDGFVRSFGNDFFVIDSAAGQFIVFVSPGTDFENDNDLLITRGLGGLGFLSLGREVDVRGFFSGTDPQRIFAERISLEN